MSRRGLPEAAQMRHDSHYVDALATSSSRPVGRIVPIEMLDPNPNQPRQVMGDLSELMASIAEKGVIEPLIVRQKGDRFQIIAGERRYQAAVQVGLQEMLSSFATPTTANCSRSRWSRTSSARTSRRSRKPMRCRRSQAASSTRTSNWPSGSAGPERRSPSR